MGRLFYITNDLWGGLVLENDWLIYNIDEDEHMWASLTLNTETTEELANFSTSDIKEFLKNKGIRAGIDDNALKAFTQYVQFGQEVIVARGKPAVDGKDGFYEYYSSFEDAKDKPKINEDGTVDYYNSLKLAMVEKGQLIAKYTPATNGEFGYTVYSEMLVPTKGKDLRPLKGTGLVVSEDCSEYRAAYDGRIYKNNEAIIVDKVYTVNGDLDINQGNIIFSGDVEVRGDVRSGLKIEADGNIFINGHVGSCILTSGGSITIRKGVQGRDRCQIKAKGDVAVSFAERCMINADGNIYADSFMDSYVVSKQQVIITSKKGCIVGGDIFAMQGITVKNAGNDSGVRTNLSVGVLPEIKKKIIELNESLAKVLGDLEVLDKNLKVCESIEGCKPTAETESVRVKIVRAKVVLSTEEHKLREELTHLESEVRRAKQEAVVRVIGTVYSGVSVFVGGNPFTVKDPCKDVIFKIVNEQVVMRGSNDDK